MSIEFTLLLYRFIVSSLVLLCAYLATENILKSHSVYAYEINRMRILAFSAFAVFYKLSETD